jgi:flagellar biosynthesis protein FlhB
LAGEKTEKATTKKRKEQRKEGNVVLSQDIVGAAVLSGIFGLLKAMGQQYLTYIANGMKLFLGGTGENISGLRDIKQKFGVVLIIAAEVLVPILIVNIAITFAATMAQTKFLVSPKAAKPKLSKINPISGFKNMFSAKQFGETVKSILKVVFIGYIIYSEIKSNLPQLFIIYNENVATSVTWIAQFILDVCFKACAAFFIIGVIDYFYQWWNYERRMRMSKQEIKDEYKETEGNPETKGRIKGQQRRLSRTRQIQAVPSADVVIRNPTHYAVALKYDREKTRAPVVVAKGQNNVALKIVEVAMASKVHIIENVPLAQALYKTVEVGDEIPEEFYKAVAEILAHIYKLKRAGRG